MTERVRQEERARALEAETKTLEEQARQLKALEQEKQEQVVLELQQTVMAIVKQRFPALACLDQLWSRQANRRRFSRYF